MKRKWFSLFLILASLTMASCKSSSNNVEPSHQDETTQPEDEEKEPFIPIDNGGGEEPGEEVTPSTPDDGGEVTPPEEDPQEEVVPYVTGISITTPNKTTYETGDELDLTGLVVTATYSDGHTETVDLNQITLSNYDMNVEGSQTITVTYGEFHDSFKILINRKYAEPVDSGDAIDLTDLSALYNAFNSPVNNYTSSTESFFNYVGAYDYYRHYQKNCIQEKVNYYTETSQYSYPVRDEYLEILNKGYYNQNNNYYSYALEGDTVEQRLASSVSQNDLTLVKSDASYQDDMFTLGDLNQTYFENKEFTRVSEKKYQSINKNAFPDFISLCAPGLINDGYYMTFSKVTIELDSVENVKFRVRLYASKTQTGKLIETHLDEENRPNWYLLFAEALVYDVNSTTFAPTSALGD